MPAQLDVVGQKFGYLRCLSIEHKQNGHYYWKCRCKCGAFVTVNISKLRNGHTKSCGCYRQYVTSMRSLKHGESNNCGDTPEYRTWTNMKTRCYNPKIKYYSDYGGRGIKVSQRWLGPCGYKNFLLDMGRKPNVSLSIDRINNDGNYSPSNCRWATRQEQNLNTRRNKERK